MSDVALEHELIQTQMAQKQHKSQCRGQKWECACVAQTKQVNASVFIELELELIQTQMTQRSQCCGQKCITSPFISNQWGNLLLKYFKGNQVWAITPFRVPLSLSLSISHSRPQARRPHFCSLGTSTKIRSSTYDDVCFFFVKVTDSRCAPEHRREEATQSDTCFFLVKVTDSRCTTAACTWHPQKERWEWAQGADG